MKKLLTILLITTCFAGFGQAIEIPGPDTTAGLNKFPSHLWSFKPLGVRFPLYNDTDTSFAIDPTYYYKQADADSVNLSKAALVGTLGYVQLVSSSGTLGNSLAIGDSTSTAFSKSLLVGQGANIVLNPYFVSSDRWFQQFATWNISGGVATATSPNAFHSLYQPVSSLDSAVAVVVEYDITAYTSGSVRAVVVGGLGAINSAVGHYVDFITTNTTNPSLLNIALRADASGFNGSIDNFTVRRVVSGDIVGANGVLGNYFKKKSGTAAQHLMADGSTSPLLTLIIGGTGDASLNTSTRVLTIPSTASYLTATNYVVREAPSGSINGSNVTFTLANTPVTGKEMVFLNGILQDSTDYSISGVTITYTVAPPTGSKLVVTYLK